MRSPAPTEVMDITNMLNKKGHLQHQFSHGLMDQHHQLPLVKHEPGMERSASPHDSEHSQYSNPHSIARSYPSPSAMQAPMHIPNPMPAAMQLPGFPDMSNMGGMPHYAQQMPQHAPPPPQQPVRAYPCSTCGKGFARRSDRARHGMSIFSSLVWTATDMKQSVFTAVSDHTSVTGPNVASNSSSDLP